MAWAFSFVASHGEIRTQKLKRNREPKINAPGSWTITDLGSFYVQYRSEFYSHAFRILKDGVRAEEVVQEALMKFILACPELDSKEHALSYLHRSIENLCIDVFRYEGSRPKLVVIDDVMAELEASWHQKDDYLDELTKVEDAVIVRQALAMLSNAERAALVMWEVDGRSTNEIALELGVSPRTVRHTVSRARSSLRRILSELVLDEVRGFTALDLLSSSYRKTTEVVKKSSKVTLSSFLVFLALIGIISMQSNNVNSNLISQERPESSVDAASIPMYAPSTLNSENLNTNDVALARTENLKVENVEPSLMFPGLDKAGIPISFSAADSSGGLGSLYFRERPAISTDMTVASGQMLKTISGSANILISQTIELDGGGLRYSPIVSFGQSGTWVPLKVNVTSSDLAPQKNGNYLLSVLIDVESTIASPIEIVATANGRDLDEAPRQVITRLTLDPSRTRVLAQAVYVVERGAGA